MELIKKHAYLSGALVCTLALGLFLILTNPDRVAIGLLIVPVVLLFLIAFCVGQIILSGLRLLKAKPRKRRMVALIGASFVTVIMILESTGGISVADVILLGLILAVVSLYIDKF